MDTNIGRMLDKLDKLDLSKNTVVIYASDQGMSDRGAPHGEQRRGLAYDPAQATHAQRQIGNVIAEKDAAPNDTAIRFEVDLQAGDYDLETWLTVGQKTRGALFVYITAAIE